MCENRCDGCGNGWLGLASPWAIVASEVEALFERDPDVTVEYDSGGPVLRVMTDNAPKAMAAWALLPRERSFGGVTLRTEVLDAGGRPVEALLLEALFDGNPACASVEVVEGTYSPRDGAYVLFEPRVVQFFADDLSDFGGIRSTLYQDVAKDVIPVGGVRYCTAVANDAEA